MINRCGNHLQQRIINFGKLGLAGYCSGGITKPSETMKASKAKDSANAPNCDAAGAPRYSSVNPLKSRGLGFMSASIAVRSMPGRRFKAKARIIPIGENSKPWMGV